MLNIEKFVNNESQKRIAQYKRAEQGKLEKIEEIIRLYIEKKITEV